MPFPDETLRDAIARMLRHDVGRLAVVDRQNPRKIIGHLGRAGILAARVRHQDEGEWREKGPLLRRATT